MNTLRAFCVVVLILPAVAFAADDPLVAIRDLMLSGRHQEAREQLVKARETFAAQPDAPAKRRHGFFSGPRIPRSTTRNPRGKTSNRPRPCSPRSMIPSLYG